MQMLGTQGGLDEGWVEEEKEEGGGGGGGDGAPREQTTSLHGGELR